MIRRTSLGLLFIVAFLLTQGVAHSIPMEGAGTDGDPVNLGGSPMMGDLNLDGILSSRDFVIFRSCYLEGGPDCDAANLDGNDTLDLSDFRLFVGVYTGALRSTAVAPEPGTLLLVASGCALIALGRSRSRSSRRRRDIV